MGEAGKSSLRISAKPAGVRAASQQLIPTGERSGLLTHAAMAAKRFVVRSDELLSAFLELQRITHLLEAHLAQTPYN
jgi:hypothetical protein